MSCIRLVSMLLLPLVCIVVRSAKQFRLRCTLESLQWRQWRDHRWYHVPDFCSIYKCIQYISVPCKVRERKHSCLSSVQGKPSPLLRHLSNWWVCDDLQVASENAADTPKDSPCIHMTPAQQITAYFTLHDNNLSTRQVRNRWQMNMFAKSVVHLWLFV